MAELAKWETFYEIVGTAAATLIGLQFIVMTLIAQRPVTRSAEAGAAFATPTIVHLATALFLSALLMMPFESITLLAAIWGIVGIAGMIYALIVVRRMLRQSVYQPEFEDWLFHAMLPLVAYAILVLSAFETAAHTRAALFGVGATALLMLFVGIHNAWDSTSYHVFVTRRDTKAD